MKKDRKNGIITETVSRIRDDYEYRTTVSAAVSIFVSLFFAAYNFALWLGNGYESNIGIAVYYALLCAVRAIVVISEARETARGDTPKNGLIAEKTAVAAGIFTCLISVALVLPIALMTVSRREVRYGTITAITVATYTTYKIVMAVRAFLWTRHGFSIEASTLKSIGFIDALTSVLSLQYTLIVTFGSMDDGMFTLCAFSSFTLWVGVVGLSVRLLVVSIKALLDARAAKASE